MLLLHELEYGTVIMEHQIAMILGWDGSAFTFYESFLGFELALDDCRLLWACFYFIWASSIVVELLNRVTAIIRTFEAIATPRFLDTNK